MIRWITENIGTGAYEQVTPQPGLRVIDVRGLVDKSGNSAQAINDKIEEARSYLREGERVVICCDYGISRSNSIAAGVLAKERGVSLAESVREIVAATGEKFLRVEVLNAVAAALSSDSGLKSEHGKSTVLIAGGTGFVGGAVKRLLDARDDSEVISVSSMDLDLTLDAVPLNFLVRDRSVDTILHLASPRILTTSTSMGATLTMLKNVLDVCIENEIRLVYLSGWEVYSGHRSDEVYADESLAYCRELSASQP